VLGVAGLADVYEELGLWSQAVQKVELAPWDIASITKRKMEKIENLVNALRKLQDSEALDAQLFPSFSALQTEILEKGEFEGSSLLESQHKLHNTKATDLNEAIQCNIFDDSIKLKGKHLEFTFVHKFKTNVQLRMQKNKNVITETFCKLFDIESMIAKKQKKSLMTT